MRALLAAGVCVALMTSACDNTAAFHSVDITGASFAHDLALTDHTGARRTLADYRGKVVTVFFGFVQCPDVCPSTLHDMAEVRKRLGSDGDKLQVLFVTVDPERDTQEVLARYLENFDASFVALRGSPEETAKVAKEFKIFFEKVPGKTPTAYTINHSAGTYAFDREGRVRLFIRYAAGVDAIVADLRRLL